MNLDVHDVVEGMPEVLELNLLHLCWAFRFEPLKLNKSGAPNRRSLLRSARGIVMPGARREVGDAVDLNDAEQLDYLGFLMALALELGILTTAVPGELATDPATHDAFFRAGPTARTKKLHDALARMRFWNELRSHAYWQEEPRDDDHLSLLAPTGERLIGARGAVFSVLRRRAPEGWTPVDQLARWCHEQHDEFLDRALAHDVATQSFVEAVVRRALLWAGLVDAAEADGEAVFRLTGRGQMVFGLADHEDPEAPHKGLVVQPNLEITAMLDATPLSVLHALYRVAERRTLADRVATFAMSAQTVQRGYATGATAAGVQELLTVRGVTPVPSSVEFQLSDWERAHRRVTIFADGILFRHPDPDALDLAVGQLAHENPEVEFVRLGPSTTFAASIDLNGLRRLLQREGGLEVDILGAVPPSLKLSAELTITVNPLECDIVTAAELARIAELVSQGRTAQVWRLDAQRLQARWPHDTFETALAFLAPRVVGGLPPVEVLRLRAALGDPTRASIRRGVTVLTVDSVADADRLAHAPQLASFLLTRLGDRAFAIDPARETQLLDVLHEIGIRGGDADG